VLQADWLGSKVDSWLVLFYIHQVNSHSNYATMIPIYTLMITTATTTIMITTEIRR